jgi:hypothetical protein
MKVLLKLKSQPLPETLMLLNHPVNNAAILIREMKSACDVITRSERTLQDYAE